jgi:uncharacterized protein (TIGR02147 family)
MNISMPNIYLFLDYRKYLCYYYMAAKKADKKFTYRYFSEKSGVKAPNFLQWLIEGKRNLAIETIPRVAAALTLSSNEEKYFHALVLFSQAKTLDEKNRLFSRLKELRRPTNDTLLDEKKIEHFSAWHNEAIRELLKFYRFDPNEKYAFRRLGKQLCPAISEKQARRAVRQMLELGLIIKEADGSIRQADQFISTGDEVNSFLVRKFHQSMIKLAGEAQDRFPKERRDISGLTMSISDNCFSIIKQEIQLFRKRIMELIRQDSDPSNVYNLNFLFFPLTPDKKGKPGNA